MLNKLRIILINTTHPGNIGGVARAMKNMGLSDLYLVDPKRFPHEDASARASGADDLLSSAKVVDSLPEALEGCSLVFGTSARRRSIQWPEVDPRECAQLARDEAGKVAIVFGREHSGLSNEEMDLCHQLVHIPCNESFSSLNLAAAVQVISYEMRMAAVQGGDDKPVEEPPAPAEQMEGFFEHLRQTLLDLEFMNPNNPAKLMRQLRRLYNKARPTSVEINILRGILSASQGRKSMRRNGDDNE